MRRHRLWFSAYRRATPRGQTTMQAESQTRQGYRWPGRADYGARLLGSSSAAS